MQSALYSVTTYFCVCQILTLFAPSMGYFITAIALLLSGTLFVAECQYNISTMQELPRSSKIKYWTKNPPLQALLLGLIVANSFANGWISLGEMVGIKAIFSYLIVSIGSVVSLSVMLSNLDKINAIIFKFNTNRHRIIPWDNRDAFKMVGGIIKLIFIPSGLFLLVNTAALSQAFSVLPITTTFTLVGFLGSSLSLAIESFIPSVNKDHFTISSESGKGSELKATELKKNHNLDQNIQQGPVERFIQGSYYLMTSMIGMGAK